LKYAFYSFTFSNNVISKISKEIYVYKCFTHSTKIYCTFENKRTLHDCKITKTFLLTCVVYKTVTRLEISSVEQKKSLVKDLTKSIYIFNERSLPSMSTHQFTLDPPGLVPVLITMFLFTRKTDKVRDSEKKNAIHQKKIPNRLHYGSMQNSRNQISQKHASALVQSDLIINRNPNQSRNENKRPIG
jgi:hypothetical protein